MYGLAHVQCGPRDGDRGDREQHARSPAEPRCGEHGEAETGDHGDDDRWRRLDVDAQHAPVLPPWAPSGSSADSPLSRAWVSAGRSPDSERSTITPTANSAVDTTSSETSASRRPPIVIARSTVHIEPDFKSRTLARWPPRPPTPSRC